MRRRGIGRSDEAALSCVQHVMEARTDSMVCGTCWEAHLESPFSCCLVAESPPLVVAADMVVAAESRRGNGG